MCSAVCTSGVGGSSWGGNSEGEAEMKGKREGDGGGTVFGARERQDSLREGRRESRAMKKDGKEVASGKRVRILGGGRPRRAARDR